MDQKKGSRTSSYLARQRWNQGKLMSDRNRESYFRFGSLALLLVMLVAIAAVLLGSRVGGVNTPDGGVVKATLDLRDYDMAIAIYYSTYHRFPTALSELMELNSVNGGPGLLSSKLLLDPWGKSYNYDRTQLEPTTGLPLVWSDGPPGRNAPIRNWTVADSKDAQILLRQSNNGQ
jgi:hypothetical protein